MDKKTKILFLVILSLGLILYFGLRGFMTDPLKNVTLESHQFESLKLEVAQGGVASCEAVAKIYHYHKKYTEAFEYWECSASNGPLYKNLAMKYLAAYYFHGLGVEQDQAKGAMYLMLTNSRVWPRTQKVPWWHNVQYTELSGMTDIEKKFEEGALLAKQYIKDNQDRAAGLTELQIDKYLNQHLDHLSKVKRLVAYRFAVTILFVIVLFMGIIEQREIYKTKGSFSLWR